MKKYYLNESIDKTIIENINIGDIIYFSGYMYTLRDNTHKKLLEYIKINKKSPIPLKNSIIYYAGPTPNKSNKKIGSIGPTTSSRMDIYTSELLKKGVIITIGKGKRGKKILKSFKENKSIYCITYGGAGAFLSSKIIESKLILFKNLGPEGIYRLKTKNFPMIVINDTNGNDLYDFLSKKENKK